MPGFSSDMWSTMCVLVEMLTGKMPWDLKTRGNCASGLIFMVSKRALEAALRLGCARFCQ